MQATVVATIIVKYSYCHAIQYTTQLVSLVLGTCVIQSSDIAPFPFRSKNRRQFTRSNRRRQDFSVFVQDGRGNCVDLLLGAIQTEAIAMDTGKYVDFDRLFLLSATVMQRSLSALSATHSGEGYLNCVQSTS